MNAHGLIWVTGRLDRGKSRFRHAAGRFGAGGVMVAVSALLLPHCTGIHFDNTGISGWTVRIQPQGNPTENHLSAWSRWSRAVIQAFCQKRGIMNEKTYFRRKMACQNYDHESARIMNFIGFSGFS
ncbi:MAG: hypothetical protein PHQ04_07645 [Opitutaceae bacterium]|nr:hypothetical protein [Opitutaceae bacterium]